MKKIAIACAATIVAIASNAASFNWSTTGSIYTPTSSTTAMSGFTAYLFNAATVDQSALVANLRNGDAITSQSFAASTVQTGAKVASTVVNADVSGSVTFYFAIVQDDYVYISNAKSVAAQATATTALAFASQSSNSAKVFDSTTAYSSAGWYQTVPEPTSGLLMLLGMAGLALKRKRA